MFYTDSSKCEAAVVLAVVIDEKEIISFSLPHSFLVLSSKLYTIKNSGCVRVTVPQPPCHSHRISKFIILPQKFL